MKIDEKNERSGLRGLTAQQRKNMNFMFQVSQHRKGIIQKAEKHMHEQFDHIVQKVWHTCVLCSEKFQGTGIAAHYRNSEACKYMKDRQWLKELPANWKQDLQRFLEEDN